MTNPIREPFEGERVALAVLSRSDIAQTAFDRPYIVISICDPGSASPVICESPYCRGVLRLRFHPQEWYGAPGCVKFNEAHGERVVEFVEEHLPDVELIVVHCEGGRSRSAGVAAALSLWLNDDEQWCFERFSPDPHVRRHVLAATER